MFLYVLNLLPYIIFGSFQCRYTLQYSYPYAYYMEEGGRKELVCNFRKNVECTHQFVACFIIKYWVKNNHNYNIKPET